jgi:hypothetical protein
MIEASLLLVVLICCYCCIVGYVSALFLICGVEIEKLGGSDAISHDGVVERFGVGCCRPWDAPSWIRCLRVEDSSCFYVVGDSLLYILSLNIPENIHKNDIQTDFQNCKCHDS